MAVQDGVHPDGVHADGFVRIRVAPDDDPAKMLELTEGDFYNLVDKDVRGGLDKVIAAKLRDERVVERWYQTLLRMKRAVEGVISAKSSEDRANQIELRAEKRIAEADKERAKFLKWRTGSIRFKTGVEEKITEAAWKRRNSTRFFLHSAAQTERNLYAERNRLLEARLDEIVEIICRQREDLDPEDATDIDLELWDFVARLDADAEYHRTEDDRNE